MARRLPFSQSCENNKAPILSVLKKALANSHRVLEVASGTGQHAAAFTQVLTHLNWQPTDLQENLEGIEGWRNAHPRSNFLPPQLLDIDRLPWTLGQYDAVFSANALHIVSRRSVEHFFSGVDGVLEEGGKLCLYGPFNYQGQFTSASNAQFDVWLKQRDQQSGIRDFEWIESLAESIGLTLVADHAMPANNRLLEWVR